MRVFGRRAVWLSLAVAAAASVPLFTPPARACGGFFLRRDIEAARRPSLAYEKTLIVFDAERRREHFVREVVFRAAGVPFGFVVPTPSRPEVAAVMTNPFITLRKSFPFEPLQKGIKLGARAGGMGSGAPV